MATVDREFKTWIESLREANPHYFAGPRGESGAARIITDVAQLAFTAGRRAAALREQPAPPSAPVGDFEDWLDRDWPLWRNNPDNPIIARLRRAWDAALTQQPAQAAPGDRNALWCKKASELLPPWQWNMVNDAVRRELRATPPGDDAAGGGHG